jgi:hypothetical protein
MEEKVLLFRIRVQISVRILSRMKRDKYVYFSMMFPFSKRSCLLFFFVRLYRVYYAFQLPGVFFIHWRYLSLSVFYLGNFFIHRPTPHRHLRHSLSLILSMNQDEACVHPLACYYCQGHCFIWQTWFKSSCGFAYLIDEAYPADRPDAQQNGGWKGQTSFAR